MEPDGCYTQDGTTDLRGRPALADKTGKWKACYFLLAYEAFERMAYYAIASNLVVYLTTQLNEDTVTSVRNVNNWSASVWITPIVGAYIADAYFGRFWTFTISSLIYVMGMILLTAVVSLNHQYFKPKCTDEICNKASPLQIALFYTALYIIAIGTGGTKPNISTLGADQFDEFSPQEKKLKNSFFNWWMFSTFAGGLVAVFLVYIQVNVGWGLGYGIPTIGLIVSLIIFYIGTPFYRHRPRRLRNPTADIFKVLITAWANRGVARVPQRVGEERQPRYTPIVRFLYKATIKEGSKKRPCTEAQVVKTKLVFGMISIWLLLLIPSTIWAQTITFFVKQGTTLDRHVTSTFQVPAASLASFVTISMLIGIPIYDRYFVPFMRLKTGNPRGITLLQRLGIGAAIQIVAILVASFVELRRIHVIRVNHLNGPKDIVPMSVFWLLPQNILSGIGDVFNAIGMLEFFYDQAPDDMQSLGTTFFTSALGVGNLLNGLLVTLVDEVTGKLAGKSWIGANLNDSHLDYYYGFLVVLGVLNFGAFLWASSVYVYKEEAQDVKTLEAELESNSG